MPTLKEQYNNSLRTLDNEILKAAKKFKENTGALIKSIEAEFDFGDGINDVICYNVSIKTNMDENT